MAGEKIHNYLKNRGSDGFYELYHELSDNRWYPYNESSWDAAAAQVSVLSHSFVQIAKQQCGNIQESLAANLPRLEEVRGTLLRINSDLDFISSSAIALEVDS